MSQITEALLRHADMICAETLCAQLTVADETAEMTYDPATKTWALTEVDDG